MLSLVTFAEFLWSSVMLCCALRFRAETSAAGAVVSMRRTRQRADHTAGRYVGSSYLLQ
jgi:hypothetical protein